MITKTLLAISVLGMGSVAMAAQNSCDYSAAKVCIESANVDLSEDCAQNQGTVGTTCPAADRMGTCTVTQGALSVDVRYYNGFQADAEQNCAENNGTYTRG
jgi:hypothetical protein